ncbi:MAG TPA: heme o synthase [Candidatus Saccharimonadales bacterium]
MASKSKIKTYYQLTKPGIIYGNLITALAGYLFASHWHIDLTTLIAMLVGLGLIIGCGCVLNNVIDKEIDSKMSRTKNRSIVTKQVSIKAAIIYGIILGVIGSFILFRYTNNLTAYVALFGLVSYLGFYGFAKRKTIYGTLVGAIAGSIPLLVGYTSVNNYIDLVGLILVMILACWQLSHFYAISLYRKDEYKAAKLPIWSVVKGDQSTSLQILSFIVLFTLFADSLVILGTTGFLYLMVINFIGVYWFIDSYKTKSLMVPKAWGRHVFKTSLTVLLLTSIVLALGPVAP